MKKIAAIAMTAMMASLLVACGKGDLEKSAKSSEGMRTSSGTTTSKTAASTSGALSGTIEVWSSGEELGRFVEGFNKEYPDINVNITVVPNADFLTKLTPTLASGKDTPDIFTGESDYVKYLVDSGYWDDLSKAPYNVGEYKGDMWDYVVNVGTDMSGVIRALSWQSSPGSVIYRRDIAKEVLGVSEPEEISKLLDSNSAMLDVAAKLKKKNIKMFASWQDIMNMQFSNRAEPWVVDGELIIDESMLEFMDMAKTISEKGYDLNVDPWAPEWSAAVESDDTFCYVLPTWGYQFVVKPAADKTKGKWGLCSGPVPYVKGGTWLGIYKDSPNKEAAWAFMKYVTCNSDAQKQYAKEYGEYVSLKSADDALAKEAGEEVLGGQNLYQFYNAQMEKIPDTLMSAYDGQLNNFFLSNTKLYITGEFTKEQAVEQFKKDAKNAYPELNVK